MAILISILLAPLLAPFTAHAVSQSDFRNMDVEQAQELFGPNVPRERYVLLPSDDPGSNVKPKQLGVVICFENATSCSSSSGNLRDGVTFRFTKMHFYDRGGGTDSWDFIFTPELNGKPINSRVAFIYRSNTGGAGGSPDSWGIVAGDPGDGLELTENRVAGLESFGDTPFAEKLLDGKSNRESVDWAKSGGISFSESQSDFADRAATDPFEIALEKLTEIVVSFSDAIVGALLWAVDQGSFSPGIQESWKVVRDVVNVLFIIVLVAMAMLSIVRIEPQKYNVRSLLPILVFAVISVNFSLLFAEIMLNTATVLSEPFLKSAQQIIEFGGTEVESFVSDGSFGDTVVMLLAAFIMLIALLVLLFFFVIRIIVVWLLAAASPILFLFMVLPVTRGEASKLLTQWIRWVYMAPIAFMLLYIGNEAAFTETGQSTGDAILSAVFYAVLVIAAVMIPLALGGRVMAMLASRGAGVAKLGGKAGLGAAGSLPLGRGMTVGELTRTGKAALELRKAGQQERAQERAASSMVALNERLGGGGLASSVTGFDAGQAQPIQNDLVDKQLKKAMLGGMNEANFSRMIAYKMAQKPNLSPLEQDTVRQLRETWGEASLEEKRMADNKIGELAAAKGVAQSGFMSWGMMPQYAQYGYQEAMSPYDPLMASVRKNYRGGAIGAEHLDMTRVGVALASPGGDDVKKYVPDFWESVRPSSEFGQMASSSGLSAFRNTLKERTNTASMSAIMDPTNRVAASDARRRAIASISRDGYFADRVRKVIQEADRKHDAGRGGFERLT